MLPGLCTSQQLMEKQRVFEFGTDFLLFPFAGFLQRLNELQFSHRVVEVPCWVFAVTLFLWLSFHFTGHQFSTFLMASKAKKKNRNSQRVRSSRFLQNLGQSHLRSGMCESSKTVPMVQVKDFLHSAQTCSPSRIFLAGFAVAFQIFFWS